KPQKRSGLPLLGATVVTLTTSWWILYIHTCTSDGSSAVERHIAMLATQAWTHPSVSLFAHGEDPVVEVERRAPELALRAMDEGWTGPPFDPFWLAEWLRIPLEARGDIPDARLVPSGQASVLQYNPMRPRGRLRFSVAHEIAHTLFPDHAERVRNRG